MSSKLYWRETIKHADSGNVNNDDDVDGHVSPASIRIRPTFGKEDPTKWRRSMNLSEGKKNRREALKKGPHFARPILREPRGHKEVSEKNRKLPRTKKITQDEKIILNSSKELGKRLEERNEQKKHLSAFFRAAWKKGISSTRKKGQRTLWRISGRDGRRRAPFYPSSLRWCWPCFLRTWLMDGAPVIECD